MASLMLLQHAGENALVNRSKRSAIELQRRLHMNCTERCNNIKSVEEVLRPAGHSIRYMR